MYPVQWTAEQATHVYTWQTCSFRRQLDFFTKHSSHAAITREDYSLTFSPLSILIYTVLSEMGRRRLNGNEQTPKWR